MKVITHFDGACEPKNPNGIATFGFVIYIDGERVHEGYGVVGEGKGMSNNVAEFSGMVAAMQWLIENGYSGAEVVVRGDSQLAINLMKGIWSARGGMYYPYYRKAVELAEKFSNISFEWVPREKNEEADRLSRKAYEEYCKSKGIEVRYMKDRKGSGKVRNTSVPDTSATSTTATAPATEISTSTETKTEFEDDATTTTVKETCMTCRWVRFSGPHVGCFYGGEYRKWLSKKFARTSKCDDYERQFM